MRIIEDFKMSIKINEELKNLITPLTQEEYQQLEANIVEQGCREPLTLWKKSENELILVDGHNRYQICQDNNLFFNTQFLQFEDLEEVKEWMINNQLGRRNLTPDQLSYYRGLKYLKTKRKKGGYQNVVSNPQNGGSTSERLAKEFNVSKNTIERDAQFAKGIEVIAKSNPKLKNQILLGLTKVKKSDIQVLSEAERPAAMKIKNEADLYNKASNIRKSKETKNLAEQFQAQEEKIREVQEEFQSKDVIFSTHEQRVKRIKGEILSAMNRAIVHKEKSSINEIRKLTEKLEQELFGR